MSRSLIRLALLAALAFSPLVVPAESLADDQLLVGDAIPRLEPFTARTIHCGSQSCLDIRWRTRGQIGPALRWDLTVVRPDGRAVYRGSGRSRVGKTVSGVLHPSTPPLCGRYRVMLRVEDPTLASISEEREVVRRHRCVRPA